MIEAIPAVIYCARCECERPVRSIQLLCCPECQEPASKVVAGRELEMLRAGVEYMTSTPRIVEVRRNVLKHNDELAYSLRQQFRKAGVFVVSLVSSPGSGKTAFLEKTLAALCPRYRPAALVGDLATDNDAARLARSGAPVRQITTGTLCHLEASMVQSTLVMEPLRTGLSVHRERRQPGLSRVLGFGRRFAGGIAFGH